MKILPLLFLLLTLASCGNGEPEAGSLPESLEEKQALLRDKRAALKELSREIEQLEAAIVVQDPGSAPRRALVTASRVDRQDFTNYVDIQATVAAEDLVDATAEISGRVLRLTVEEGDNVRRGQLIATVDVEPIQKQIEEVETSLSLATTVFERQERLWEQRIGSEMQYLEAKNQRDRLQKNLERLRLQLNKRNVYAPISGAVERVLLQSGELAAPGMPIVQLLNTNDLVVAADLPETYLNAVRLGEQVSIRIPALDLDFEAPITQIGRTIDEANRTFRVEADLPRSLNSRLKPNLLAEMLIRDYTAQDVIALPADRVQQDVSGQHYVFIVAEGENGPIARRVAVTTGRAAGGRILIESGLQGGEQLILEGARNLTDGQPIEVTPENPVANG